MKRRSVVVTGVGLVTAIGLDEDEVWTRLMEKQTGIRPLSSFDTEGNRVANGAEIDDAELAPRLRARGIHKQDRALGFALEAAGQALEQAGLIGAPPFERQEIAMLLGSGVGPAESVYKAIRRFLAHGPKGMRPSTVPNLMANTLSAGVSLHYQLTGTNQVVVSACTSSTNAIGHGFRMIRDGYVDAALCGGSDAYFNPMYYGAWNNLGVFSPIEDPARAYRPFDADRQGCLLGEGSGMLVLETRERAEARGARIRAELLGYGESADATHLTSPDVEGQARAMRQALACAGIAPGDVGYVNAHGTATIANDLCESRSIREVFGAEVDRIPVGSLKPYFGHLLGASGAVESIVTLLALERRLLPPNLNLERPDPECRLRLIGAEPEPTEAELAMKNSFGFGGGNGVLVFRRGPDPS